MKLSVDPLIPLGTTCWFFQSAGLAFHAFISIQLAHFCSTITLYCLHLCSTVTSFPLLYAAPPSVKPVPVSKDVKYNKSSWRMWHQWHEWEVKYSMNIINKASHHHTCWQKKKLHSWSRRLSFSITHACDLHCCPFHATALKGPSFFLLPTGGWSLITEWAYLCSQSCRLRQRELPGLMWMLMWIILQVRKRQTDVTTRQSNGSFCWAVKTSREGKK